MDLKCTTATFLSRGLHLRNQQQDMKMDKVKIHVDCFMKYQYIEVIVRKVNYAHASAIGLLYKNITWLEQTLWLRILSGFCTYKQKGKKIKIMRFFFL